MGKKNSPKVYGTIGGMAVKEMIRTVEANMAKKHTSSPEAAMSGVNIPAPEDKTNGPTAH